MRESADCKPEMSAEIRVVYADPQIDGMDVLYGAIAERLRSGMDFEAAYAAVISAGGPEAATWIRFCVQCAGRFATPPAEVDFLAGLELFSRNHGGL